MRDWWMGVGMQPLSPWSTRPTSGSDSGKWHGIPLHPNEVFVGGNAQRWGAIFRKKALHVFC